MAGEMIRIDIGGDTDPFVAQASLASAATVKLIDSVQKLKDKLKQTDDTVKKSGDGLRQQAEETKKAGREMGAMGGMAEKAGNQILQMATAYAGVQGIQKAWAFVKDEIRAVIDAQKELGDMSANLRDEAKAVMNQTGMTYDVSKARLLDVMAKGRFTQPAIARQIINTSHAAWSETAPDQWGQMTDVAADFVGRRGLDAAGSKMLLESALKFKARDPESLKRSLAQTWAGSKASMAEFPEYTMGLGTGAPELAERGVSPAMILAMMTRGRQTKATGMQTAELMRQLGALTDRPDIQKAVGKESGMTGLQWGNQTDKDLMISQLGQFIAKYAGTKKLQDLLPPEAAGRTKTMFTPEGLAFMQQKKEEFANITPADFEANLRAYDPTIMKLESDLSSAAQKQYKISESLERSSTLEKDLSMTILRIKGGQPVEGMSDELNTMLRWRLRATPEYFEPGMVLGNMGRADLIARETRARAEGDYDPLTGEPLTAYGRQLKETTKLWWGLGRGGESPLERAKYVEAMESLVANTSKTADNTEGPKREAYDPN